MPRSSRRDRATGTVDRIAGRVMDAIGSLTGKGSQKAKGKAARARGGARRGRGAGKRTAKR